MSEAFREEESTREDVAEEILMETWIPGSLARSGYTSSDEIEWRAGEGTGNSLGMSAETE
jgi:hypothetical protein